MARQNQPDQAAQLTAVGCAFLVTGISFTTLIDGGRLLQAAGVVIILVSAVMLGASIRMQKDKK